jgi:cobalamin biosynthesis protein CobT
MSTIGPCASAEPVEQDDLVEPVEELRPEVRAHHAPSPASRTASTSSPSARLREFGAEVRGQDDQRVAEVDRAALPVGQAAVVEHLQQHVEHVGVRLLDLVEQHT